MIALNADDSLRVERGSPVEVTCVYGMLWITCEGDLQDRFLKPGESLMLTTRGRDPRDSAGALVARVVELPAGPSQAWLERIFFRCAVSRPPETRVRALLKPDTAG